MTALFEMMNALYAISQIHYNNYIFNYSNIKQAFWEYPHILPKYAFKGNMYQFILNCIWDSLFYLYFYLEYCP